MFKQCYVWDTLRLPFSLPPSHSIWWLGFQMTFRPQRDFGNGNHIEHNNIGLVILTQWSHHISPGLLTSGFLSYRRNQVFYCVSHDIIYNLTLPDTWSIDNNLCSPSIISIYHLHIHRRPQNSIISLKFTFKTISNYILPLIVLSNLSFTSCVWMSFLQVHHMLVHFIFTHFLSLSPVSLAQARNPWGTNSSL